MLLLVTSTLQAQIMPQIEFYVLSDSMPDAHLRYACRLAEQAVDRGQRVFMRMTAPDDLKRVDDLLWTFGDRSFLPHEVATSSSPSHPKIRILLGVTPPPEFRDVVINLSSDAPSADDMPPHLIELVPADVDRKRSARERFKTYRDRGIDPTTHNV